METHSANGHLVGGQRPCFVRADDRGTAQCLHRGQAANDGVFLGHAAGPQGQAGGYDSGQPFGDGSHCQRHSDFEIVDSPPDPGAAVDRVVEVSDVYDPHGNANQGDDFGKLLSELVQLLLQWRSVLLRGCHLVPNLADLCVHTSSHHHPHGFTRGDVRALKRDTKSLKGEGLKKKNWTFMLCSVTVLTNSTF